MGQKVHPIGFRLGIIKEPQARWYASKKGFTQYLQEDLRVRRMIMTRLADAGVSRVDIERSANQMTVTIHAAKPGIVIGKSGVKVEELRRNLEAMTEKKVRVTIQEIRQPELDAHLVGRSVAEQLEKRVAFRRAMKQAVGRAMRFGAKGVRVQVSGRLGGSEMSRRESDRDGRVPLHTLRADIDFAVAEAFTTYGVIGVKVWIYKGEILPPGREPAAGTVAGRPAARAAAGRAPLRPPPAPAVTTAREAAPVGAAAPSAPAPEEAAARPAAPVGAPSEAETGMPAAVEAAASVQGEASVEAPAPAEAGAPSEVAAPAPTEAPKPRRTRAAPKEAAAEESAAETPAPARKPRASRKAATPIEPAAEATAPADEGTEA